MVTRTGTSITTTIERTRRGLVVSAVRIGLGFTRRDVGRAGMSRIVLLAGRSRAVATSS